MLNSRFMTRIHVFTNDTVLVMTGKPIVHACRLGESAE